MTPLNLTALNVSALNVSALNVGAFGIALLNVIEAFFEGETDIASLARRVTLFAAGPMTAVAFAAVALATMATVVFSVFGQPVADGPHAGQ